MHQDILFSVLTRVFGWSAEESGEDFLFSGLVYRLWETTELITNIVVLYPVSDAYTQKCMRCRHT
jgi:hypothetical protein